MIKKTLVQLKESFLFTIHAVVMNRLRTILSLLGITIGIFAIISVLTIVDSLEKNIRESVASLGDNIVYIQKWPWGGMEGTYAWWDYLKRPVPKINEYEEIKRRSSLAENLAFSVSTSKNIEYRDNIARNVIIWANTHEFQDIRKFELSAGRYFTLLESSAGRNVSIIGHELAGKFFKNEKPIGKEIKILGRKTSIIGIAAKEGKNLFGGGSLDNVILIPINYAKQLVDVRKESLNPFIMVEAKPNIKAHELSYELKGIMRSVRGLKPREVDDFALNQSSLLSSSLDQVFSIINFAGWFIGAFSILVGGFGIANIMFVSVKERTSIIGIQKAMGAKKYFILSQFLFEALLLALSGGILGLLMVFAGTIIVNNVTEFTIHLGIKNIITGILLSSIIGIVSGFTPALSASRLDPVKAIGSTF